MYTNFVYTKYTYVVVCYILFVGGDGWLKMSVNHIKFESAVSRIQQGQREPSVKVLRSPFSVELWRHCVLCGRTQRRILPRRQSGEMKI